MRIALFVLVIMSLSVSVIAVGNDSVYVSDTIPTIMGPGHTYNVTVTMRNTGTNMWHKDSGHRLGAVGDSDPFTTSIRNGFGFYEGIANGQEKTFTITMTAPTLSNINEVRTFTTDWQMIQEGVGWFGATLSKRVIVSWAAKVPDAPTVSFPASGEVFMSNRPDITWNDIANDGCEVHICTANSPDSGVVWNSGYVDKLQATSYIPGALPTQKILYIFVRLHNPHGWGKWSKGGHFIYTAGEYPGNPINPQGDAYHVEGVTGFQYPISVCYNPDQNQYMVAYTNRIAGQRWKVSYHIINGDGTKATGEVTLEDDMNNNPWWIGVNAPQVAYNSVQREYLIVYMGWREQFPPNYTDNEFRGQHVYSNNVLDGQGNIIHRAGDLRGGSYSIRTESMVGYHKLAYSPDYDKYLLTYDHGGDVVAYHLDGVTGQKTAANPFIVTGNEASNCGGSSIVYNPDLKEFFIIYQVDKEFSVPARWFDYYGQRVSANTDTVIGDKHIYADTPAWDMNGDITYDNDLKRYLMAYQSAYEGGALWGQFISPTGDMIGNKFMIQSFQPTGGGVVSLAWNPYTKEYLACWQDSINPDNFARRISQTGEVLGERLRINGDAAYMGNFNPIPILNTHDNEFMICWYNWYNDVYMRRYKTYPVPSADTMAPSSVSFVIATPGYERNILSWTNPSDADFARVVIRFSTSSYPATPTDGSLLTDKANTPGSTDSFTHIGLIGGTKYYYSLFAYDCWGNYSPAVNVGPTALRVISIINSNFGIPSSGWTLANWGFDPDPLHWGTIGWEGGVGNPTGGMRCKGYGDTDSDDRYLREGAEMKRIVTTTGLNNINISYDLRAGTLGDPRSGVGTGTGSVLKNDIQDQLIVYYSTAGVNGPWTEVDWLGHNALLSYLTYGKRYIDLSSVSGINDNANFALKFIWQFNSKIEVGDYCDMDNVKVTGSILGKNSTCGSVKSLDNTTPVSFADKVLYLRQSGYGYIEDVNRTSGIRVEGSGISSLTPDQAISVIGTMQTSPTTGERYIQVSSLLRGASASVKPLAMNQRGLKKVLADGMYVKTFGRVKTGSITSTSYVILDGSDSDGIKVITTSAPSVTANTYVSVTGAAGTENGNRVIYQTLLDTYAEPL